MKFIMATVEVDGKTVDAVKEWDDVVYWTPGEEHSFQVHHGRRVAGTAFEAFGSNGCLAYLGYASKQVQEPGTEDECEFFTGFCGTYEIIFEDEGELLRNLALHRCGCGIDAVVEVEEDDIR